MAGLDTLAESGGLAHSTLPTDNTWEVCHSDIRLWTANHPRHTERGSVTHVREYGALHLPVAGTEVRRVLAESVRDNPA